MWGSMDLIKTTKESGQKEAAHPPNTITSLMHFSGSNLDARLIYGQKEQFWGQLKKIVFSGIICYSWSCQIASVNVLSRSAFASKGCLKATWIRNWAPVSFFLVPVISTSKWCRWMRVSMLEVFLFPYPITVERRRHRRWPAGLPALPFH